MELTSVPAMTLQRVINAISWLVAGLGMHDNVSVAMKSLHWLPVAYSIQFKLCLMMYAVVNGQSQDYIVDVTMPISAVSGHLAR